jgi:hypothetical protein
MSPLSFIPPLRSTVPGDLLKIYISDGGSVDPEKNVTLFNIIKKARAVGVPKANIESALQKVPIFFTNFFWQIFNAEAII